MKKNNLYIGVAFVFMGLILLLNNLGILDFSFWHSIYDLWPLLLVVFGVHLMTNKPSAKIASWALFFIILIIYGMYKQNGTVIFNLNSFI